MSAVLGKTLQVDAAGSGCCGLGNVLTVIAPGIIYPSATHAECVSSCLRKIHCWYQYATTAVTVLSFNVRTVSVFIPGTGNAR